MFVGKWINTQIYRVDSFVQKKKNKRDYKILLLMELKNKLIFEKKIIYRLDIFTLRVSSL